MKRLFIVVTLLALFVAPLAVMAQDDMMMAMPGLEDECATPENLPDVVTVGAIYGLSGNISVYGGSQQNGTNLALMQINESGYLGEGTEMQILFEDSGADAEGAIGAMTKLVEEDGVAAVLGPTLSTHAFAADPIAQENGVPVMGV
ncbi:MAG: ABC transporter substrate-binding protein, partial [Chloroflexota bacterium]